jgi:hypothetical protein
VRAYALEAGQDPFDALRRLFAKAVDWLGGDESAGLAHGELETQIAARFWDLARQAVQDHLDLRAAGEEILVDVVDAEGVARVRVETGRERVLATIFGAVWWIGSPTGSVAARICTPPTLCSTCRLR